MKYIKIGRAKLKSLKVLFVASEAAPFAKIGGLGEVMYSLPRALNHLGHDARIMIPKYLSIDPQQFPMETVFEKLIIPDENNRQIICNVKMLNAQVIQDLSLPPSYFLENNEYYEKRANVYGYTDDAARWAILSKGVLEFIRQHNGWQPDIIVSADWQTGLIPDYLHTLYKDDPILEKISTVFSIHNIYYQGMFDHHFVPEVDNDAGQSEIPSFSDPRLLKTNFMRRGIVHADVINTVSPTYAGEIMTPEYGELLDPLLREKRARLFGILNGIDYDSKNPETDEYIEFKYNTKSINNRIGNKLIIQKKFNLTENKDVFLIGIISRLTEQKGFDLLIDAADALLRNFNFQLVVLGQGDGRYMNFFKELQLRYPKNIGAHLSYDEVLPHLILAGADAILIPSRFEPSGLTQMEAMRYGAIPIVRKTGGLADSVSDYNPVTQTGNGFVFNNYDHYALLGTIIRALETYQYKEYWYNLQKRAMESDFSWYKSANEYIKLFKKAIQFHFNTSNDHKSLKYVLG